MSTDWPRYSDNDYATPSELEDDARSFVRQAIEDGIESGVFRDVDVEAATTLLLSAHDGGVLRTTTLGRNDDADTLARGLEEYLSSVLRRQGDDTVSDTDTESS